MAVGITIARNKATALDVRNRASDRLPVVETIKFTTPTHPSPISTKNKIPKRLKKHINHLPTQSSPIVPPLSAHIPFVARHSAVDLINMISMNREIDGHIRQTQKPDYGG